MIGGGVLGEATIAAGFGCASILDIDIEVYFQRMVPCSSGISDTSGEL